MTSRDLRNLSFWLFACLAFWVGVGACFSQTAMTTAHRTTGFAPLAVHFSAIDRTSVSRNTSTITGLTVSHVRNLTAAGTGTLSYTNSTDELTYAAPSDSAGTAVDVSADLKRTKVYSNNGVDFIVVDIETASLPGSDQSDDVTITSYRDSGVVQPTAVVDAGEPDYAALAYVWEFGDSSPIIYQYGTLAPHNSNTDSGSPIAAHVYKETGSYTVTLSVWDENGTKTTYTQGITVSDQEATATVYYVDATLGSNSNDGLYPTDEGGGNGPLQTWDAGIAKITGDNVVVKFKRGEAYTTTLGSTNTLSNDDVTICAYYNSDGSDDETQPKPTLAITGSAILFTVDSGVDDLKFCNLDCTGGGGTSAAFLYPNPTGTPSSNILMLSVDITTMAGIATGSVNNRFGAKHQFYVDCTATDIGAGTDEGVPSGGGNGLYLEINESAILGTLVDNLVLDGEHCCRIQFHNEGLIAHSSFIDANSTKGCITLRGGVFGTTSAFTGEVTKEMEYTSICYNLLDAIDKGGRAFDVRAAADGSDVRQAHIIVHGNRIDSAQSYAMSIDGWHTMFRRNVVTNTGGAMEIDDLSFEIGPNNSRIIGNTISSGNAVRFIDTDDDETNNPDDTLYSHNIIDGGTFAWLIDDFVISEFSSDYNLGDTLTTDWSSYDTTGAGATERDLATTRSALSQDANSLEGNADFTNAAASDYTLQATSDAIDAGDSTMLKYLRIDGAGNRVTDGSLDLGAFEYGAAEALSSQIFIPGIYINKQ